MLYCFTDDSVELQTQICNLFKSLAVQLQGTSQIHSVLLYNSMSVYTKCDHRDVLLFTRLVRKV